MGLNDVRKTLSSLNDTRITGQSDGDALVWDATAGEWVPGAVGGGTIDGSGTTGRVAKWTDANTLTNATAGTDYVTPTGVGSALTVVTDDTAVSRTLADRFADLGFNVHDYGAVGDGVTDDADAINAAVAAAAASGRGGRIIFPPGHTFAFGSPIVLDGLHTIALEGQCLPQGLGVTESNTTLLYTGTGTDAAISAKGTQGVALRNLRVMNSDAGFTGYLVDLSGTTNDTNNALVDGCQFQGVDLSHGNAAGGLLLNKAISSTVHNCQFSYMALGIRGVTSASYSNAIRVIDCKFVQLSSDSAIRNAGQQWKVDGCTFEPNQAGKACMYAEDNGFTAYGPVTFIGCWSGDATTSGNSWLNYGGNGLAVVGCYLAGTGGGSDPCILLGGSSAVQGVTLINNYYEGAYAVGTTGTGNIFGFLILGGVRLGDWINDPDNLIFNPVYLGRDAGSNQIDTPLVLPDFGLLEYIDALPSSSDLRVRPTMGAIDGGISGAAHGEFAIVTRNDGGGTSTGMSVWTGDNDPVLVWRFNKAGNTSFKPVILKPYASTASLPTAAASYEGALASVVHNGDGDSADTKFYQCVSNAAGDTFTWEAVGGGSGTVTSVGLTVPSWLAVTGSPVTTSGTLAVSAATGQTQNRVLATPDGSSGALTVRSLAAADIPDLSATYSAKAGNTSLVTVGTVATGTWQATKVGLAYGGTNADLSATGGAGKFLKQTSAGAAVTVATISTSDVPDLSATYLSLSSGGTVAGTTTFSNRVITSKIGDQGLASDVQIGCTYTGGKQVKLGYWDSGNAFNTVVSIPTDSSAIAITNLKVTGSTFTTQNSGSFSGTVSHDFTNPTDVVHGRLRYDLSAETFAVYTYNGSALVPAHVWGALASKITTYTAAVTDRILLADATAGAFAITLPAASAVAKGKEYTFKKTDSSVNAVTVTAAGTDTIDGAGTYALSTQYQTVTVVSDGASKWWITGKV